jgi:hypothetical protein
MIGGFFCVSSTKKRKTSNGKTKKAKKKNNGVKKGRKTFRKYIRKSQRGGSKKNMKKTQKGGETVNYDLTDNLGQGTYPVTNRGHSDCSGVHHK